MNDESVIQIQVEKGTCDCCYEENVEINLCPSNNKCEYSMCNICIKNLKQLTDDKKRCPACREEIFSSDEDTLSEEEMPQRRPIRFVRCCYCCLIDAETVNRSRICVKRNLEFIFNAYIYTPAVCLFFCVYQTLIFPIIAFYKCNLKFFNLECLDKRARPIVNVLIMKIETIIILILLQLFHLLILDRDIRHFWPKHNGLALFLLGALKGFGLLVGAILGFLIAIGCLFHCCCDERGDNYYD